MTPRLKEILESDYRLVLISGDYHDCPSCNDSATLIATTFFDEKDLIQHMIANIQKEKFTALWVIDTWGDGHMEKLCDITTRTGGHRVHELEFDTPDNHIWIAKNKSGDFEVADKTKTTLFGTKL